MKQKKKTKIDYRFVFDDVVRDYDDSTIVLTLSWTLFIAFILFLLATIFCLLISVISSIYFLINIIGFIIGLNNISYIWSGGDSMSPIPTYLGLVAIAGAIMAYICMKWLTTYSSKRKEEWEEDEQLFKWYLQLANSLYL